MSKLKAVNGTFDILPDDAIKWNTIETLIRTVMSRYNYREIRTPLFEQTALFARSIGEDTDIVSKEMYTFEDSGGKTLTLRPENTASVARALIEHTVLREMPQFKAFYIGPMFRRERPQKGRYRQFHQFGIEAVGPKSAALDAEVIRNAMDIFSELGLQNLSLEINSVGDKASRETYKDVLRAFLQPQLDQYCENCQRRFHSNILRVLDCKVDADKNAYAPKLVDHLNDESAIYFSDLQRYLHALKLEFTINHKLVRGLDYYSDTVFEITSSDLGSQSAVCGGGRYDGLFEQLGGQPTAAIGYAGGMERLLLAMESAGVEFPQAVPDLFLIAADDAARERIVGLLATMRNQGIQADTDYLRRSVKAQMRFADKIGARYTCVIGESELQTGSVNVKHMADGNTVSTSIDAIADVISAAEFRG